MSRQESSASQYSATHGEAPTEDVIPSNHSSFHSRFTPGSNLHGQRQDIGQNSSSSLAKSSLRNTSSSKDLLEAAEDTIEELRAEAKMWERNARKSMIDLDLLRKKSSENSRHQADLDMELSAACSERDGLKLEIEQLKRLLEEFKVKQMASEHSISHAEGITHLQKELESEIKFQKESNTNLSVQLKKTQESNIELLTILQELEETIEQQRLQIDNLSAEREKNGVPGSCRNGNEDNKGFGSEPTSVEVNWQMLQESQNELQAKLELLEDKNTNLELEKELRNKTLFELEADFKSKLSAKEDEVTILEAKLSDLHSNRGSKEERFSDGVDSNLIKEIEELREKVQELESDCNELTEENLELIFKLKESKKDPRSDRDSFNSLSSELQSTISATASEPEVDSVKSQLKQDPKDRDMLLEAVSSTHLEVNFTDLQNKIADLELQLRSSQDNACKLEAQLRNSQVEMDERGRAITALQKELEGYQDKQTNNKFDCNPSETGPHKLDIESCSPDDMSKIFLELHNQLNVALTHVKRPWCKVSSPVNIESESDYNDSVHSDFTQVMTSKLQAEAILRNFIELNELLEAKIVDLESGFQHIEVELMDRNHTVTEIEEDVEEYDFKESASYHSTQARGSSETDFDVKVAGMSKSLLAKGPQIEELEASLSLKEGEIQVLRHSQKEMEERISALEKEKVQLEENLEVASRGSSITSKSLDDVSNDMTVLTLDSHVSVNKMLERKSSELESSKREIELHLLELEEENVQLSERLSGMEAQLRYLTNEKESSRLDLENSKSLSTDLRNEIKRLETEMENQKVDLKYKLQEMQKRWSEAQEECEYLKRANPKLQATAESLIEECDSMQKLNGELRKQKLELHERCTQLETELRGSRNIISDCSRRIEILEAKLSLMQKDMNLKQNAFAAELDSLLQENKEHREKLILEESLVSQMYMEKTVEVESLQREVAHLTEQISATHDEREKIASNAVRDVSTLRADKARLESALQDAQANVKSSEIILQNFQQESETMVQGLQSELASSIRNQDLLMVDNEKLQRSLDEVKLSEARFRSAVSGLELKLTASEYEKQQVVEEIANLKVQLQKIGQLQDVIVDLKNSLNEVKFEKGKLEASLQLLSGDCEELKAEKISYIEKISSMQKSVSELEECKRCKVALEEKLLRLEGDLTAKEASCAQDAEVKNELNRIKRANSQFQRKVQSLQDEKNELLKRAQELEDELKLKKEGSQQSESISKDPPEYESITRDDLSQENSKHLETEKLENGSAENRKRPINTEENGQHRKENGNKHHDDNDTDLVGRVVLLENELSEALEANQMYKLQLKKLLTEGENNYASGPKAPTAVEAELKDIRERYFHMSLKFAEVEAQREELVMQMKNLKGGRRWFS